VCLLFLLIVVFPIADMLPIRKGLIWLFLATVVEIPPVASVANSMYPSLLFIMTSLLQVFISLDLNGRLFPLLLSLSMMNES
jgi:hypothetical protein